MEGRRDPADAVARGRGRRDRAASGRETHGNRDSPHAVPALRAREGDVRRSCHRPPRSRFRPPPRSSTHGCPTALARPSSARGQKGPVSGFFRCSGRHRLIAGGQPARRTVRCAQAGSCGEGGRRGKGGRGGGDLAYDSAAVVGLPRRAGEVGGNTLPPSSYRSARGATNPPAVAARREVACIDLDADGVADQKPCSRRGRRPRSNTGPAGYPTATSLGTYRPGIRSA